MLKISYAVCLGLSLAILSQFTVEMCVAAWNRKKIECFQQILCWYLSYYSIVCMLWLLQGSMGWLLTSLVINYRRVSRRNLTPPGRRMHSTVMLTIWCLCIALCRTHETPSTLIDLYSLWKFSIISQKLYVSAEQNRKKIPIFYHRRIQLNLTPYGRWHSLPWRAIPFNHNLSSKRQVSGAKISAALAPCYRTTW